MSLLFFLPIFPLPLFYLLFFFNNSSLFCSSHYLYLSLGLYPSSSLSLTLPSICLRLDLFLPFCLSFSGPLSAAVQYSSITVVLIIPFSACSHTVIYQINNPPLLLILCSPPTSPFLLCQVRMLSVSNEFSCQSPIITTIIINI